MDSGPFLATRISLWSEECNLASLLWEGEHFPFWEGHLFHDLYKVPELTLSFPHFLCACFNPEAIAGIESSYF